MTNRNSLRKMLSILLFISIPFLTTGCWDRLEVNDIAIVVAMGVDLEPDGKYRFSVQIPLAGQMGGAKGGGGGTGGEKSYYIDSETGTTLREAANKLQGRMSRRMIYGHYRVLVFGEEIAKKGIRDLLDVFTRWPENRLTSNMIIAKGRAIDLLEVQPKLERFSAEAMRELIKVAGYMSFTIKNIAQSISHPGSDPLIPYMGKVPIEDKKREDEIQALGYAQFRGDRMVDVFEGESNNGIVWLRRQAKPIFLTVRSLQPEKLVFNVSRAKTKITPSFNAQGRASFKVDVEARLMLVENMSSENLVDDKAFEHVKANAAESIKQQIEKAIQLIQKNKADSANLGLSIYQRFPGQWEETYKKRWRELISSAVFDVHVDADIVQNGLTLEHIVKEEKE